MSFWKIPIEINSKGHILMSGPSKESISETINGITKKSLLNHIRDKVTFITINVDSIRRVDEKIDESDDYVRPIDRMSKDGQKPVKSKGRESNMGGDSSSGEPPVVEEEHSGVAEGKEPMGGVQPSSKTVSVAQPMGAGESNGVRSDTDHTDEAD